MPESRKGRTRLGSAIATGSRPAPSESRRCTSLGAATWLLSDTLRSFVPAPGNSNGVIPSQQLAGQPQMVASALQVGPAIESEPTLPLAQSFVAATGAVLLAGAAGRHRRGRRGRKEFRSASVAALAVGESSLARHRSDTSTTPKGAARGSVLSLRAVPEGGYCESPNECVRRKTRTVTVGAVKLGSDHRIATQTMATTLTHDVEATVAQIKQCADMGIDIVRITVQGMREAKACEFIKKRLLEDGYTTPIVADIHFTPKVALVAAEHCDKIRVNPGNFADGRKSFDTIDELTEDHIKEAQEQIEEAFAPLVLKLKEKNKALRIGVNHGSLSERILFQYGDSPEGMVASAMEFAEICRKYDYHNFVFSMKSSNPKVMVEAYRSLAREMYKRGWDYPLHLGVTEAGGGADGRIKSAVGIGALLLDGLGDTVRVSLTEDPDHEAAPCKALRAAAEAAVGKGVAPFEEKTGRLQGPVARRECDFPIDIPLNHDGSVLSMLPAEKVNLMGTQALCDAVGLRLRKDGDVQKDWKSVDCCVILGELSEKGAENVKLMLQVPIGVVCEPGPNVPEGATVLLAAGSVSSPQPERVGGYALTFTGEESAAEIEKACSLANPRFAFLKPASQDAVTYKARRFFALLGQSAAIARMPAMLWFSYPKVEGFSEDDKVIRASADFGSLFVDGFGEGILWDSEDLDAEKLRESSFNLLQASRMRISKTEFISCPSCGRTLFNLQKTTKRIQARTGHLPGVRIAVMGCIVNGPGEMADADFGYVGSGVGKVDLYVKYDCVRRAIDSENAVDQLVDLIKEHGKWVDPPEEDEEEVTIVGAVATA
mmetsp:Transcript_64505/g.135369  ORF Transcript_64505/g.135369 Transcript_64505/m.135369 type:complete len:828 (-) Transcript_64505:142-2625(-)